MSRSKDAMPSSVQYQIACDLFFALHPNEKRFSGNSRIARTIYPFIEEAYRFGLEVGSCGDERDRLRVMKNIGKPKIKPPLPCRYEVRVIRSRDSRNRSHLGSIMYRTNSAKEAKLEAQKNGSREYYGTAIIDRAKKTVDFGTDEYGKTWIEPLSSVDVDQN